MPKEDVIPNFPHRNNTIMAQVIPKSIHNNNHGIKLTLFLIPEGTNIVKVQVKPHNIKESIKAYLLPIFCIDTQAIV